MTRRASWQRAWTVGRVTVGFLDNVKIEVNVCGVKPDTTDRLPAVEAQQRLRQAGLRATRPRVLVYRTLREAGGHRTVDEIVEWLAARGIDVPRMSVYNVAADLTAAALVMRADAGPGAAVYEAGDTWHHHFVCRVCGGIEDIPCVVGSKPCLRPSAEFDGIVDEAQIIFRGQCARCVGDKLGVDASEFLETASATGH